MMSSIVSQCCLLVVLLIVVVLPATVDARSSANQFLAPFCSRRVNASLLSSEVAPSIIVVSEAVCCELCHATRRCRAAVYHSGNCSLRSAAHPIFPDPNGRTVLVLDAARQAPVWSNCNYEVATVGGFVKGGFVVIGGSTLAVLNISNGMPVNSYITITNTGAPYSVDVGSLIIVPRGGITSAVPPFSQLQLWQVPYVLQAAPVSTSQNVVASVIAPNGTAMLAAFGALDGTLAWAAPQTPFATPIVTYGGIVVTFVNVSGGVVMLAGFDAFSGFQLWTTPTNSYPFDTQVLRIGNSTVYTQQTIESTTCVSGFDAVSGESAFYPGWCSGYPGPVQLIAADASGVITTLIADNSGANMQSLSASGQSQWQVRLNCSSVGRDAKIDEDTYGEPVIAYTCDSRVEVRLRSTGQLIWRSTALGTGNNVTSQAVSVGHGMLVAGNSSCIFGFRLDS